MIRFVDIDGTICETNGLDYEKAKPKLNRIAKINAMYDGGDIIVYYTARGSGLRIECRPLTEKQLKEWGCKYHFLKMDKPLYDMLIDDRAQNDSILDDEEEENI